MNKKNVSGATASRVWRLGIHSALLAMTLLSLPGQSRADCKIKSVELPVTMVGSRAIAKLGINGTEVPLIVDSGAFFSSLTPAAAQQLGLEVGVLPVDMRINGLTGEIDAGLTRVRRLKLLDAEIPDVSFIVGGNDESTGGSMGLLGRNVLAIADAEYDLANGVIRLMFPSFDCRSKSMAYWAGDKPVHEVELLIDKYSNTASKTPPIEAVVKLNGQRMRALLDSGAQSLVSLNVAKQAGLTDLRATGKVFGAGKGQAQAWIASADSFEIGSEKVSNVKLRVADFEQKGTDMLLGIDFFLSHRIYISKSQRKMYFTHNGGNVFALSDKDLHAEDVAPQTEAGEPLDAAAYALRGAAAAARRDFVRALADLDRACEMAPQVAEYFVRRGEVQIKLQHGALARKDLDQALQLSPDHPEALLLRVQLRLAGRDHKGAQDDLQTLDKTLAPQSNRRLQVAQLYQRLGLLDRALPQWAQWMSAHPQDIQLAEVLNNSCWARTRLNIELEQAQSDCEKAIDLNPKEGSFYNSRAWLQMRLGHQDKALADYERALELQPDNAYALYGRGVIRSKQGQGQKDQSDFDAARKLIPSIDALLAHYGLTADKF